MLFYAAAGSYKIIDEDGKKMPYIRRLHQFHPISIPEFAVWSSLLWEVMTYDEAKTAYDEVMRETGNPIPSFDEMLKRLVARKLVVCGEGYTGMDALFAMLSNTFVLPVRESKTIRLFTALKLLLRGRLSLRDFWLCLKRERLESSQQRVLALVKQTPLSAAELVRCFDWEISDVSTQEKLIERLYPDDDSRQITLPNETYTSGNVPIVLSAIANLYMAHRVILERA